MNSSHPLIQELAGCRFAPGTWTKRFVRDMSSLDKDRELTARQEACAWRVAYIFRRQLSPSLAEEAIAGKRDHSAVPVPGDRLECSVCKRGLTKRDLNGPCPGPPEPKVKKANTGKGKEPEIVPQPQEELFA